VRAPTAKLRLANVLALTWQEHIDRELRYITVHRHKTVPALRRPQVVPIRQQLRLILQTRVIAPTPYFVENRAPPVETVPRRAAARRRVGGTPIWSRGRWRDLPDAAPYGGLTARGVG
jgi:hypothetical protein